MSKGITNSLQLALLVFALNCVLLKRRGFPLLNVCSVHGFITEPGACAPIEATAPIGACAPGV